VETRDAEQDERVEDDFVRDELDAGGVDYVVSGEIASARRETMKRQEERRAYSRFLHS
jgi:hypothetical protein